jgi:hypothetical protein
LLRGRAVTQQARLSQSGHEADGSRRGPLAPSAFVNRLRSTKETAPPKPFSNACATEIATVVLPASGLSSTGTSSRRLRCPRVDCERQPCHAFDAPRHKARGQKCAGHYGRRKCAGQQNNRKKIAEDE